ncbi:MAG: HTH domain-containing protein, partial [Niameybacter sp.]
MKINRLLEIVILLLNKKSITAKELANRFEVSTRTIYRDIDDLSAAGIPIYTNKGGGGGIALLEEYTLNKTLLSDLEKEQLLMTLKTLEATQYTKDNQIVEKLGILFSRQQDTDWVEVQ